PAPPPPPPPPTPHPPPPPQNPPGGPRPPPPPPPPPAMRLYPAHGAGKRRRVRQTSKNTVSSGPCMRMSKR
ncbi:hypothetical protein, partial [Burkholderia cenocepacia]|uniref:hypothetical protein n=1 Tax=Burkholderia cenocepacia TaxID=95486 RepID=UPI0023498B66